VESSVKVDPINPSLIRRPVKFLERDLTPFFLLQTDGQSQRILRSFGVDHRPSFQRIKLHNKIIVQQCCVNGFQLHIHFRRSYAGKSHPATTAILVPRNTTVLHHSNTPPLQHLNPTGSTGGRNHGCDTSRVSLTPWESVGLA